MLLVFVVYLYMYYTRLSLIFKKKITPEQMNGKSAE